MTDSQDEKANRAVPPKRGPQKPRNKTDAQRQPGGKDQADDAPAGEELTGEGSPGLTIMGGGGHA
jgi:hypothetical protein